MDTVIYLILSFVIASLFVFALYKAGKRWRVVNGIFFLVLGMGASILYPFYFFMALIGWASWSWLIISPPMTYLGYLWLKEAHKEFNATS